MRCSLNPIMLYNVHVSLETFSPPTILTKLIILQTQRIVSFDEYIHVYRVEEVEACHSPYHRTVVVNTPWSAPPYSGSQYTMVRTTVQW